MPDAAVPPSTKPKVFISYSRKDMAFADRLETALKARGFEPLIDRTEIYAFEEWWKRIEALIARADTVVFILSPDAVSSEIALKEVSYAASLNKRFAPVVCRHVDDKAVPEPLARLNFVFFDDLPHFEQNADRLTEALNTDIGWVRQHTDFGEQARRWDAVGRPSGMLLRSPVLEQAERWIASRPTSGPAPTDETQTFIRRSRQGATQRRNILTGALAGGLVMALILSGVAYWQRGIAVEQRGIAQQNEQQAKQERDNATRNFNLAQKTAEGLVFDIAQGLQHVQGMSAETVRKILETARATFEQLATSAPNDLALQRSRGAMLNEFGDTYLTLGDLNQALQVYRDAFAIKERLAAIDQSNTQWQRDLSVSYNKVGDVLMDQGKLGEALKAYRGSLAVIERLTATDSTNTEWQRDLAVSHERIADVLMGQGYLAEALTEHEASRDIISGLAATDPSNTEWQRDLSLSYSSIGNVLNAQGALDQALKAYRDSLAIKKRLAVTDPSNTQWQADLSIAYGKVGEVLMQQGKLDEALKAHRDSLAIWERLAATDGSNTEWQRDLAVSHFQLAWVYERQGRIADALLELTKAEEIMTALVAIAPENAQWKKDLDWSNEQIARLQGQAQAR